MNHEILAQLRAATAPAHAALEAEVAIEQCVSDLPGYTRLLEKFFGFYQPLETRLKNAGCKDKSGGNFDLEARLGKADWLAHDLSALGLSPAQVDALPRCARLPHVERLEQAYGCAYVLEGATLGGRHISALLAQSRVPETARTFFRSYGSAVGERWREFTTALNEFAARPETQREEILQAANATFATLHEWMRAEKIDHV